MKGLEISDELKKEMSRWAEGPKAAPKSEGPDRVVPSACQHCHCECGVLIHVKNGRVVKIEGNPDHPQNEGILCPKALSYVQLLYHPDRLKYPLKRVGQRGEGKWERVSWGEAMDTIAKRLLEIREKHGPEALAWGLGDGPKGHDVPYLALMSGIGSPNILHGCSHYCLQPLILADNATYGTFLISDVAPDYRNSNCVMIWGANPPVTHPAKARHIFIAMDKGAKLIVVDPRFTALASKAHLWLQVRPGTDDALALGMLNVIINEELYDKQFVADWCVGFEKLKKRVQEYPLNKVSEITSVPEDLIRRAARIYAAGKPSSLHARMGIQMNTNSVQTARALAIMLAVCGYIDVKGGNLINNVIKGFKPRMYLRATKPPLPEEIEWKRMGAKEFPLHAGPKSLTLRQNHSLITLKSMVSGDPYQIRGMLLTNDMISCMENVEETMKALANLEFMVVSDLFMTPTAERADFVLPCASWVERDEIADSYYIDFIGVRQKAIEPLYECKDEKEIIRDLMSRMSLKSPYPFSTVEELIDYMLRDAGITFGELKKRVTIPVPVKYKKYEEAGFKTPSGKVELYSGIFEEYGYDPLPYHKENPLSPVATPEIHKEYPLILITGSRVITYYHSANRQIPWLREIYPNPMIEIHPDTAAELGIVDGQWVYVETPYYSDRRVKQKAVLTRTVAKDTVHVYSHWWFPEKKGPDHGLKEVNINMVMSSDPPYDPIIGSTPLRGILCRVRPIDNGA